MRHRACRLSASPLLPCLLFLLLTPLAGASLAAAPLFTDPLYPDPLYPGAVNPIAVAVADFNGDQALDFAMLGGGDVVIFLADGQGDFQPLPQRINLADYPSAMVTTDFDRDGNADLVITDYPDQQVIIYLGSGDGTFVQGTSYSTGQGPQALAVADLNGDGLEDLVVANQVSNDVSVILKKADGTSQPPVRFPAGGLPKALAVTDFNKDGHPDIAVALWDDFYEAVMLFGHGDGVFDLPFSLSSRGGGSSIASADFNRDGNPDIVVGNGHFHALVILGDGAGGVQGGAQIEGRPLPWLAAADFNGDGIPDLATPNAILPGVGDGSFGAAAPFSTEVAAGTMADINGDGSLDLAAVNIAIPPGTQGAPGVVVLYNDGHGHVGPRIQVASISARTIVTGDFNGDGLVDLAASNARDQIAVLLGHGDGTFAPEILSSTGIQVLGMAAGDFDGDGRLDLAVHSATGGLVSLLRGQGDGSFRDPVSTNVAISPSSLVVGEFNGDGRADLVSVRKYDEFLQVLLGKPDGTFEVIDQVGPQMRALAAATGDFNADGKQDVAVAYNGIEKFSILPGNGDGTFGPGGFYGGPRNHHFLTELTVADLNGDGKLDLAAGHAPDAICLAVFQDCGIVGEVSVLLGEGNGTLGEETLYDLGTSYSLGAADFDQDGHLDLISDSSTILFGPGDGTFGPVRHFAQSGMASVIGDFNNDGWPDVALANGWITVALNQGSGPNHPPVAAAGPDARLGGAQVLLDGSASSDPDSTLARDDIVSFDWFEDYGRPRQRLLGTGETLSVVLGMGRHRITLVVVDHAGASSTDDVLVQVVPGGGNGRASQRRGRP